MGTPQKKQDNPAGGSGRDTQDSPAKPGNVTVYLRRGDAYDKATGNEIEPEKHVFSAPEWDRIKGIVGQFGYYIVDKSREG